MDNDDSEHTKGQGQSVDLWSVDLESLAPLIPNEWDALRFKTELAFAFQPAHAMAIFFSSLAENMRIFSVKLPEADYSVNIQVRLKQSGLPSIPHSARVQIKISFGKRKGGKLVYFVCLSFFTFLFKTCTVTTSQKIGATLCELFGS